MESFFSEEFNIYSNDTLTLFKYFNDEKKFINNNFNILKNNNNFLEFILPNQEYLEQVFKLDPLFIYKILDFFDTNYDTCSLKKNNIYDLLNKKNYPTIEYIWDSFKDVNIDIINEKAINEKAINEIYNNSENYFYFLFNQLWLKKREFKSINNNQLQTLGEQLLVCYYYNLFYTNNKDFLINKQSNYENFFKVINVYTKFKFDHDNKTIIFDPIEKQENVVCNDFREKLKLFFHFSLENKIVNKKMIIWFYVFFKKYLTKQLQNDYLFIIYKTNINITGFINNIFKVLGKEFYEYTEEDIKDIFDNFKQTEYIYKVEDDDLLFLNNSDLFEITNNIFLLKKLNQQNQDDYELINIKALDNISLENLYFIFLISPLKNSLQTVVKKIKDITQNNIYNLQKIESDDIFYIYNSCVLKNFNKEYILFTNENVFRNDLTNFIDIKNFFNIEILFYKIIMYLNNYEIIPKLNLNLKKNIEFYKFDLYNIKKIYLSIYPSEEENINGYKKT